jgi:N6-L-threonylcarbamoyladenine synthase
VTGAGDLVLGIETSCDDTAVALVDPQGRVVSACVASQATLHNEYGGVYPEVASRAHIEKIIPAVQATMEQAGANGRDLAAVAVTRGPGLIGSLIVGLNAASGLGQGWAVPVAGVNHLRGHLRSADLEEARVRYPAVILLVSGGHTLLARMRTATEVVLIGNTLDDSVGEAYDKVARMLGLGYPGGPVVDKLATTGSSSIEFPRPMLGRGLDFSFSGLKSAVERYMAANRGAGHADIAASFVAACMDVLIAKCRIALTEFPAESLVVVGGVAASPQLRAAAQQLCDDMGVSLCLPPLRWSTDNGAMIALAGWDNVRSGTFVPLLPEPRLKMETA